VVSDVVADLETHKLGNIYKWKCGCRRSFLA